LIDIDPRLNPDGMEFEEWLRFAGLRGQNLTRREEKRQLAAWRAGADPKTWGVPWIEGGGGDPWR